MKEMPCPLCFHPFVKRNAQHKRCLDCSLRIEKERRRYKPIPSPSIEEAIALPVAMVKKQSGTKDTKHATS